MAEFSIHHPLMGLVKGKKTTTRGCVQYLGIKYGKLADRFAQAELNHYDVDSVVDATKLGPYPVSSPDSLHMETNIIQQSLPNVPVPEMSDTECLNLNISVPGPLESLDAQPRKLPVLVYIHGGAFLFGSSWYPHYVQDKFVELTSTRGHPVIAVIFNYRLGLPGLLTSQELREAGYPSNNSLLDQKTCFRWIKKYIAGFGGDPDAITAVGQSAGAMSICYHLQSTEALFYQAALLGGSSIIQGPSSTENAESLYHDVVAALKLTALSPSDRIKALLTLSDKDLVQQAGFSRGLNVVLDGNVIPEAISVTALLTDSVRVLPGKQWCDRLFMIQGNLESSVIGFLLLVPRLEGLVKRFCNFMKQHFERQEAVEQLLALYNLSNETPDHIRLSCIIEYFNDVCFYAPACLWASSWPKGYVGNFNEGNPWAGPSQGKANHMFDTALLWQQYNIRLSSPQRDVAEAYALDIAAYADKSDGLPLFKHDKRVIAWGPSAEGLTRQVVKISDSHSGRRPAFFGLMEALGGLSALLEAYGAFAGSLQAQP